MARDIAARMEEIVGAPPRLQPLAEAELGAREWKLIHRLREIVAIPLDAPVHPLLATLCRHPEFFFSFMQPGLQFMTVGSLSPRDRELAILRTGWLCGAPYEWGEHVASAKRIGITSEEIERITQGSKATGWSEDDRAILKAAEELHADAMISDETWALLSHRLDERQLIELPMIVGHYHKAAFVQNSLRFALRPNNPGLAAR